MTTVVQVANFVAPHSGGIRTVLRRLAEGYADAGRTVVQIVPAAADGTTEPDWGRRIELRGRALPATGYRVLSARRVIAQLEQLRPDVVEVHDRTTLRGLGRWARARGVRAVVVSHERLDRLLTQWTGGRLPTLRLADASNRRLAAAFDAVVGTTEWAATEFRRIEAPNLHVVPLGVDLAAFRPAEHRSEHPPGHRLVTVTRLSPEKRPGLAVATLAELHRRGVPARLVVAGDGPLRRRLERQAAGLPVEFVGHLHRRSAVAGLLASADVVLAPGPVETFGLAALEALAAGTPVVGNAASALGEIVGTAGRVVPGDPAAFADAVEGLLRVDPGERTRAARAQAERFSWSATVDGFLAVHRHERMAVR